MKSYSYSQLDELIGEVLPERAVQSTLLAGGDGGSAVVPLCQADTLARGAVADGVEPSFVCSSAVVLTGR